MKTKMKKVVSLLVVFTMALSSIGTAYAASAELKASRSFKLQDTYGYIWTLDLYFGFILIGSMHCPDYDCLALGYIVGKEMVLWANSPGSPYPDWFVYAGMWDFATMKFHGKWLNSFGSQGPVDMWLI